MDKHTILKEIASRILDGDPDMRMAICMNCSDFNSSFKICKVCKCYMPAKTHLKAAECPKKNW
jgi:hypothetical protein